MRRKVLTNYTTPRSHGHLQKPRKASLSKVVSPVKATIARAIPTSSKMLNKNVNDYLHFLTNNHTNEHDIDWVLNLRKDGSTPKLGRIPNMPPEAYFKQTESSKNKHLTGDLDLGVDTGVFKQLMKSPISHETVNFSLRLRSSEFQDRQLQQSWNVVPMKERGSLPRFLNKKAIKKLGSIDDKDLESAYEGYLDYPKYELKALRDRNFNNFRHMTKAGKSFQQLCWETSLRG